VSEVGAEAHTLLMLTAVVGLRFLLALPLSWFLRLLWWWWLCSGGGDCLGFVSFGLVDGCVALVVIMRKCCVLTHARIIDCDVQRSLMKANTLIAFMKILIL